MINFTRPHECDRSQNLDYVLRRAEEETIAAIRSGDPRASAIHCAMARAYSAQANALLIDPGTA